jgi:hypothetical protein
MTGNPMPMKKLLRIIRFAAGGVFFAMQACAPLQLPGSGGEPTMAQWARVEEDLRRANIERQKFDASHPLVGKRAAAAAQELIADGYQCEVGLMDSVRSVPGELRIVPAKKALLFCERKSSDPEDFCAERFVRLAATWPDINVSLSVLKEQMDEVVVTQRTFRCDTPADVAIRLKHRQEGRQD